VEDQKPTPINKRELMWFSTFIFVLSALVIRLVINLQVAVTMKIFKVSFEYQPFGNVLERVTPVNWSDWKVFIAYAIGPMLAMLVGLILIVYMKKNKFLVWKTRLILTWHSFILVHLLPLGLVTGMIFYDDYGSGYTNIINSPIIRMGLSMGILALVIYFRGFWIGLFYRAAINHQLAAQRSGYIKYVFIRPWALSVLVLFVFALVGQYWAWLSVIGLMGFVVLPFFNWVDPKVKLRLSKKDASYVFKSNLSIVMYVLIIVALLAGSIFMRMAL
jgi:hypothetical protein